VFVHGQVGPQDRQHDPAFSFTESDCANPTLMAHLRGLKCERLYGRD
jgi:hypothetical protein